MNLWILSWTADSRQGETTSLHCFEMEREVLQMLCSNQAEQPVTESIYRLMPCRSMLPTHNLNIIAWEEEEGKSRDIRRRRVKMSENSGCLWFHSFAFPKMYSSQVDDGWIWCCPPGNKQLSLIGKLVYFNNRASNRQGISLQMHSQICEEQGRWREEEMHWLTRLISDRAAISDPTGVMYPDILYCQKEMTLLQILTKRKPWSSVLIDVSKNCWLEVWIGWQTGSRTHFSFCFTCV